MPPDKSEDLLSRDLKIFEFMLAAYKGLGNISDVNSKKEALLELYNYHNYLRNFYPPWFLAKRFKDTEDAEMFEFFKDEFKKQGCNSLSFIDIMNWELSSPKVSTDFPIASFEKFNYSKADIEHFKDYKNFSLEQLIKLKSDLRIKIAVAENVQQNTEYFPEDLAGLRRFITQITDEIVAKTPLKSLDDISNSFSLIPSEDILKLHDNLEELVKTSKIPATIELKEVFLKIFSSESNFKKYNYVFHSAGENFINIKIEHEGLERLIRLETPSVFRKYRSQLAEFIPFNELYAKRQYLTKNKQIDLVISEPFESLDLHCSSKSIAEKYKQSITYCKEMALIFKKAQEARFLLNSATNSYWLVTEAGLKCADNISISPILDRTLEQKDLINYQHHGPQLGRNLYQCLTGCSDSYLKIEAKYLDFTYPIFDTDDGKKLKILIQNLLNPDKNNAFTLDQAIAVLSSLPNTLTGLKIGQLDIGTEVEAFESIISHLRDYKNATEVKDKAVELFYTSIKDKANQTNLSDEESFSFLYSLKKAQSFLESDQSKYVMKLIEDFHTQGGNEKFSIGKKRKAERIAKALVEIPLENRDKVLEDPAVIKAIQSHRLIGFGKAKSFFASKTKLKELGTNLKEDKKNEPNLK